MPKRLTIPSLLIVMLLPFLATAAANAGDELRIKVRADLFGHPIMEAKAVYKERIKDEELRIRLVFKIQRSEPFQSYPFFVNGIPMGVVTANSYGEGKLKLEGPGTPPLHPGDLVIIGPMSGVATDRSPGTSGETQRYRTRADLEGATPASGTAKYNERYRNKGLRRVFKVEIEDAQPNTAYTVFVNGQAVGALTTDSFGTGRLHLRTPEYINGPDDGEPMPNTFPSLLPGDVVTVGPLSGVIELR